jgi:serine-type D-Ala-D-Ala carboxypeptidase/endopeptidase
MRHGKTGLVTLAGVRFACLALLVWAARLPAMDLPSDAEIHTILQKFIERDYWGVGMVVGIVDEHGTRIISYGKLDNGESPEVNGDTLFEIGRGHVHRQS